MTAGRTLLNIASATIVTARITGHSLADETQTGVTSRAFGQTGESVLGAAANQASRETCLMEGIQNDFRVQEAVRLLNENSSCSLCEIARRCHLSISRLSHLFKAQTGFTVENYRRHCRFQAAARMLETTDLSIKEIAYAVGYHHTSSFVRAFTLRSGASPNSYRKRQLRQSTARMISR
jgi:AraC-like DNA-binding protein